MKRILSLALTILMLLSLAACGASANGPEVMATFSSAKAENTEREPETVDEPTEEILTEPEPESVAEPEPTTYEDYEDEDDTSDHAVEDDRCGVCGGTGICVGCHGRRRTRIPGFGGVGTAKYVDCGACGGTGRCRTCDGTGRR